MSRFLKRGPTELARYLLDVRETLPTDIADRLQLTLDLRASRSWEYFHERVIRWGVRGRRVADPVAFVGMLIQGFTGVQADRPKNGLIVIETIRNHGAFVFTVRVGNGGGAGLGSTNLQIFPTYADQREGPADAAAPISIFTSSGGLVGTAREHAAVSPGQSIAIGRVQLDSAEAAAEPDFTILETDAVNQAFDASVAGAIIYPR